MAEKKNKTVTPKPDVAIPVWEESLNVVLLRRIESFETDIWVLQICVLALCIAVILLSREE